MCSGILRYQGANEEETKMVRYIKKSHRSAFLRWVSDRYHLVRMHITGACLVVHFQCKRLLEAFDSLMAKEMTVTNVDMGNVVVLGVYRKPARIPARQKNVQGVY